MFVHVPLIVIVINCLYNFKKNNNYVFMFSPSGQKDQMLKILAEEDSIPFCTILSLQSIGLKRCKHFTQKRYEVSGSPVGFIIWEMWLSFCFIDINSFVILCFFFQLHLVLTNNWVHQRFFFCSAGERNVFMWQSMYIVLCRGYTSCRACDVHQAWFWDRCAFLCLCFQNSGIEKAFLFDVVSKIYIATDSSPVDMQTYKLCCDMIDVVIDISCIYG